MCQLLETKWDFGAPQPRQHNQDIGDIGSEVVGRRESPRSVGFVVEKSVIAAVVVAIGGEQIEDGAPEAFARLFRAAERPGGSDEFLVIDLAVGGATVQETA